MSSLDKGLRALALLSGSQPRLRVTDVAQSLGLPKSSASRLLGTLARHGLLERGGRHTGFEPGLELQRLGRLFRSDEVAFEAAQHALAELVSRHPATAYLASLQGLDTLILRVYESPTPVRYVVSEGARLPAYVTAIGKALLMRLESQELLARLPERLSYPSLSYSSSRAALLRELRVARERGFTELVDSAQRGIGAAAVAVGAPQGRVLGLALCWMERDMRAADRRRAVRDLVDQAHAIGQRIGDPFWVDRQS